MKLEFRHVFGGREITVPCHYCPHISLLHAKVAMITGVHAKRRLTWGNGSDTGCGLGDVGLHTEQMSPSRPGGQMLVVNFLSYSGCDTWLTTSVTWHSLYNAAQILDNGSAEQPR